MNTQHTPEPWKILDYYQRDIGQSHNCTVARMLNPPVGHSDANARRIVACVNACAGISTESLEAEGLHRYSTKLADKLMELEQQRNDLLARIHRDGGHYAEENGIDKAIDDAHIKVAELYLQRDELLTNLKTALSVNRSCTGQMRRTTALITEKTEKNYLRCFADSVDSIMDNLYEVIAKADASNG